MVKMYVGKHIVETSAEEWLNNLSWWSFTKIDVCKYDTIYVEEMTDVNRKSERKELVTAVYRT